MMSSAQTGGAAFPIRVPAPSWMDRKIAKSFQCFFGVIFFCEAGRLAKQISVSERFTLAQQAWFRLNGDQKTYLIKRGWNEH